MQFPWEDWFSSLQTHPLIRIAAILGIALAATLVIKVLLRLISRGLRRVTSKTPSHWDDYALDIVDGLRWWVLATWLFFALYYTVRESEQPIVRPLLSLVLITSFYQFSLWGFYLLREWKAAFLNKRIALDPSSSPAFGLFYKAIQAAYVSILVLVSLSLLGVDISALVAGLGVGGIAIALAAQNVLGDLLASLSIVLDKPFVVGDFVIIGDAKGTVSQIGIKTTRLTSLWGEELIISNKDILESKIQNYKRMRERRIVQKFGVVYGTPVDQLRAIPDWIKQIVGEMPQTRFDRCHFSNYGESSLDFEMVFYVLDPDYNVFMDIQQRILIAIYARFEKEKIDFAFPTRTVYWANPVTGENRSSP